jgi:hypothetical protein
VEQVGVIDAGVGPDGGEQAGDLGRPEVKALPQVELLGLGQAAPREEAGDLGDGA